MTPQSQRWIWIVRSNSFPRIQFLTRFSSNLIQITGREGAGKTWLAQRYLEQWADNSNQTLLLCHRAQIDSQHRSIILKQLVAQPVFNEQDPLQQSVEHMLGGRLCQPVTGY